MNLTKNKEISLVTTSNKKIKQLLTTLCLKHLSHSLQSSSSSGSGFRMRKILDSCRQKIFVVGGSKPNGVCWVCPENNDTYSCKVFLHGVTQQEIVHKLFHAFKVFIFEALRAVQNEHYIGWDSTV